MTTPAIRSEIPVYLGATLFTYLKTAASLVLVSCPWPGSLLWLLIALGEELDPVRREATQSDKMQGLLLLSLMMLASLGGGLFLAWKNRKESPTASGLSLIIGSGWILLAISISLWAFL
jgi:membrane protein DedA with SNARE-associated domain